MNLVTLKLLLALGGILAFFSGVRVGSELLRWIGIGLVVSAYLLRFLQRRQRQEPTDRSPDSGRA